MLPDSLGARLREPNESGAPDSLGTRLRLARIRRAETQAAVAARLVPARSQAWVSAVERGTLVPAPAALADLAHALETTVPALLDPQDAPTPLAGWDALTGAERRALRQLIRAMATPPETTRSA